MKTNTTHKWLKLVIAASIAISTNGAWAACEAEAINSQRAAGFDMDAQGARWTTEQKMHELSRWSEADKKSALLANEKFVQKGGNSDKASLARAQANVCYLRALGVTSSGSTSTAESAKSNVKDDSKYGNCNAGIAAQERDFEALNRRPLPQGSTPPMMRVMWMSKEAAKLLRNSCPPTPAYQKAIAEHESAYKQAETACNQMSAAKCAPNPYR